MKSNTLQISNRTETDRFDEYVTPIWAGTETKATWGSADE